VFANKIFERVSQHIENEFVCIDDLSVSPSRIRIASCAVSNKRCSGFQIPSMHPGLFPVSGFPDITLDNLLTVYEVDIADEFHADSVSLLCFERQIVISDISLRFEFLKRVFCKDFVL